MEELYNNVVELDNEYILPSTTKWKNIYKKIVEYFNKNLKDNNLTNNLNEYLNILIKNGDVHEDVVLKTALYYYLYSHTNLNASDLKESNSVVEGINILLSGDSKLSTIFENTKYKYLNKIKLASLLCNLKLSEDNDIVKKMEIYTTFEVIEKKYKDYCCAKLYRLVKESL